MVTKQVEKRIEKLSKDLEGYKSAQAKYSKLVNDTILTIRTLNLQLNRKEIEFTEHAKIRYLERVMPMYNIDINKHLQSFIDLYRDNIYRLGGSGTITMPSGDSLLRIVVKDFKIITIIDKEN